jgi:hypothetical protein
VGQPVAIVVSAVAGSAADLPAIDGRAGFRDASVDLALALLQPESDFQLLLDREVLEVECLARPDAVLASRALISASFGAGGEAHQTASELNGFD